MTDRELADAAWAELTKTTASYPSWVKMGRSSSSHWAAAKTLLDQIGTTAPPVAPKRVLGFSTGAGPNTPTDSGTSLTTYYAKVKEAGGNAVRFDCRGLTTQFDNAVKAALLNGLNVLILFPDDPTLAGPCAAKYVPLGVTDYETGNEPNIRNITPLQFFNSNNAAYQAIKKVSAATKVISAGLAPYGKYAQGIKNPVYYLEQTLKLGKLLADQLGWHPYPYYAGASAADMMAFHDWSGYSQVADTTPSAHSLWDGLIGCTELGAPTWSGGVTEQAQADVVRLAIPDLERRSYIGDIYWYSLQDRPDLTGAEAAFGIYRKDWSPKPALAAFQAVS